MGTLKSWRKAYRSRRQADAQYVPGTGGDKPGQPPTLPPVPGTKPTTTAPQILAFRLL